MINTYRRDEAFEIMTYHAEENFTQASKFVFPEGLLNLPDLTVGKQE